MTKMFDVQHSDAFRRVQEAEKVAHGIFHNQPLYVPGILQVPAYAEEMIRGISGLSADDPEVAERVAVRNRRHAAFLDRLRGADAPRLHVVLDESVLRRAPVGAAAMREQIEHLIDVSQEPTVQIGVIPLEHGPHPGLAGTFEVHDTADGSLVFFEGAEGDRIREDPDRVAPYRELVGTLMAVAASGESARALMTKLIKG